MRLRNLHPDIYVGVFLDVICIYLYMLAGKFRTPAAAVWPQASLVIVALLSTLLIIRGARRTQQSITANNDAPALSLQELSGVAAGVASMILYAVLMNIVGFFISTAIFMPISMFLLGQRKWLIMIGVTVSMELFVWFLFVYQLKLRMP